MSETKFTPGPWRLQMERDGLQVCASDGRVIYSASWARVSSRAKTVEDVRNGVGFHPINKPPFDTESAVRAVAQQIADWTLFAAAPDLYAAGDALIRLHDTYTGEPRDDDAISLAMSDMRAALRAARGEG